MRDINKAYERSREALQKKIYISDACARVIAAEYSKRKKSPLSTAFIHTGAIPKDPLKLWNEMFQDMDFYGRNDPNEFVLSTAMKAYLERYAKGRTPIKNWSRLWL